MRLLSRLRLPHRHWQAAARAATSPPPTRRAVPPRRRQGGVLRGGEAIRRDLLLTMELRTQPLQPTAPFWPHFAVFGAVHLPVVPPGCNHGSTRLDLLLPLLATRRTATGSRSGEGDDAGECCEGAEAECDLEPTETACHVAGHEVGNRCAHLRDEVDGGEEAGSLCGGGFGRSASRPPAPQTEGAARKRFTPVGSPSAGRAAKAFLNADCIVWEYHDAESTASRAARTQRCTLRTLTQDDLVRCAAWKEIGTLRAERPPRRHPSPTTASASSTTSATPPTRSHGR
jgi:hypothetical protein